VELEFQSRLFAKGYNKYLSSVFLYRIFTISDQGVTKGEGMAQAKTEIFSVEEIELADIAKTLSHPARIKILGILNDQSRCMAGEIVEMLPLSQSTVSQHLKELKRVGLIKGEVEGPSICYCLDEPIVAKTKAAFTKLFSSFKCC